MASAPSGSRKSRCIMPLESYRSPMSPIDSFDQAKIQIREFPWRCPSYAFLLTDPRHPSPILGKHPLLTLRLVRHAPIELFSPVRNISRCNGLGHPHPVTTMSPSGIAAP